MTILDRLDESVGETGDYGELPALVPEFHLEPRCRICRNDRVREMVNELLAGGASYAMVLRALGQEIVQSDKRDRVTIDSIRNHSVRHFPVQNVAKATYREILERRAKENGVDFAKGVATAITPLAFLESVMVKGYQTLVDPDTRVDVNTGMVAAGRLQALIDSRANELSMLEIRVQLNRVIEAVRSTVPQSMWSEISRQLHDAHRGLELLEDDEDEAFDPNDDPLDANDFDELDD